MKEDVSVEVREKVALIFPAASHAEVLAKLQSYGKHPSEPERTRVQLAILKLTQEDNLQRLSRYVQTAKMDYRDVLAWAEYPNHMKLAASERDQERVAEARQKDREQYERWVADGEKGSR